LVGHGGGSFLSAGREFGRASTSGDHDPEKTYSTGQIFLETPNQLHAVSRNASSTKPARLIAVMLAEKGKQLTVPA
jgi:quercetin dioxygenase-like cupin family protein